LLGATQKGRQRKPTINLCHCFEKREMVCDDALEVRWKAGYKGESKAIGPPTRLPFFGGLFGEYDFQKTDHSSFTPL
jgi:hypothetical protein